ncbi:MAG TPA: Fur family transcriptional regulator [Candidatus Paceibacterota bacterium]|nr:Fur family transcriptional regulator [Candidatus Paceibacterota bacterium]
MRGIDASSADTLRAAGMRATRQRTALLSLLTAAEGPLPVEALAKRGKGAFDTATAYRMLEAFQTAGIVHRIELAQGRALFERAGTHHHHAVCRSCGRIEDVEACVPASIDERVRAASGFARIDEHALEFFGLCRSCV